MSIMAILSMNVTEIKLLQDNSIEPYLRVILNVKLPNNGNNRGVSELTLFNIACKLSVSSGSDGTSYTIGYVESLNTNSNTFNGVGSEANLYLYLRLSPFALQKIEQLRDSKDLFFTWDSLVFTYGNVTRDGASSTALIQIQTGGSVYTYKYPRSEWIDDLEKTEFGKLELIEVPKLDFAGVPLTTDVMALLHDAERAMKEGRSGDVLSESRKALNALYKGIDDWGSKLPLTKEENEKIENAPSNEKDGIRRSIYVSRLMEHPEKGKRFNSLRSDLYQYLSLDTHEADHKGIVLTKDDAVFAFRTTANLCAIVLKQLEYHLKKEKR